MMRVGTGVLKARQGSLDWRLPGWEGWGQIPELGHGSSQLLKVILWVPVALLEVRIGVQV